MGGHIGPPLRKLSSTAVPPGESQFSDFRRALPKETGVKRVETAGVYPLAPRRGARQLPLAEVQRKTPRPFGRTACAPRAPRTIGAEKNCRPNRTNTLTQFAYPGQPVLRKTKRGSLS